MIKHAKVSGVANTGAAVGGADWDAPHIWPVGSVFTIAIISLFWDGSAWTITDSSRVSGLYAVDPGHWLCNIDLDNLSTAPGSSPVFFAKCSMAPHGSFPSGWTFTALLDSISGDMAIYVGNNLGAAANPTIVDAEFFVEIIVAV